MRIPPSLFDVLTGLSDALRGETRSYENGVLVASSRESFDAATTNAVVVSWAADGGVSTNVLRFGRTLETVSPEGRTLVFHDSYGYPYLTQRSDPTGNLLSKIYADGSVETHTYTADGLPLRTTFPGGRWVENRYDGNRRLAGVSSDDPSCEAEYAYDAFGRTVASSNAITSASYGLAASGVATNEVQRVGTLQCALVRTVDSYGRVSSIRVDGGVRMDIAYAEDGRIVSLSNADCRVVYRYGAD